MIQGTRTITGFIISVHIPPRRAVIVELFLGDVLGGWLRFHCCLVVIKVLSRRFVGSSGTRSRRRDRLARVGAIRTPARRQRCSLSVDQINLESLMRSVDRALVPFLHSCVIRTASPVMTLALKKILKFVLKRVKANFQEKRVRRVMIAKNTDEKRQRHA